MDGSAITWDEIIESYDEETNFNEKKGNCKTENFFFIGRNCCGKKMLQGKSCNFCNFFFCTNIIFHSSQLFIPTTYTLRVLIDVFPLIFFIYFFASPHPHSLFEALAVYYFFKFFGAKIFFFIHID